jgi:hypothetical protein
VKDATTGEIITPAPVDPFTQPPVEVLPYWPLGLNLDVHVYLSTNPRGDVFTKWTSGFRKDRDADLPHFVWSNITYGDWNEHRKIDLDIKFPEVRTSCIL